MPNKLCDGEGRIADPASFVWQRCPGCARCHHRRAIPDGACIRCWNEDEVVRPAVSPDGAKCELCADDPHGMLTARGKI